MKPETTIFYDVDTQRDFILPGGALYVPGAEKIASALGEVTRLARAHKIRVVCSVDRHFPGDHELKRNGGEFADHCMDGTAGQRKIDETTPLDPLYVPNHPLSSEQIKAALHHKGELVFEKQDFDVFIGNQHARTMLPMLLQPFSDIVIYGVFTEICVAHAVNGLLELSPSLHIVTDAIADIGTDADRVRAHWKAAGVDFVTLTQLKNMVLNQ
jgi:nicotinamidase/pyrazinamidase